MHTKSLLDIIRLIVPYVALPTVPSYGGLSGTPSTLPVGLPSIRSFVSPDNASSEKQSNNPLLASEDRGLHTSIVILTANETCNQLVGMSIISNTTGTK